PTLSVHDALPISKVGTKFPHSPCARSGGDTGAFGVTSESAAGSLEVRGDKAVARSVVAAGPTPAPAGFTAAAVPARGSPGRSDRADRTDHGSPPWRCSRPPTCSSPEESPPPSVR